MLVWFFSDSLLAEKTIRFQFQVNRPSRQNLISRSQYYWQGNALVERSHSVVSPPDSLQILALMVAFQPDEDLNTTGDGQFDLSVPEEPVIDPPPHDQSYFEDQLTALANYYRTVSSGQLRLGFSVHPYVLNLPNTMTFYNPATSSDETYEGKVRLFYDAITLADEYDVALSDFDVFVVFHAGVGNDVALDYDDTPSDIPSAFVNLDDLRSVIGEDDPTYSGIPVAENGHFITEGIILPEAQSQEGYEIGLLGTMTLIFGWQLGLPSLWNTQTGYTGIGSWGLMDQGSNNFNGILPAEPCAWSKVFLGWAVPEEIRLNGDWNVACSKAASAPGIYKIPISTDEYFLVENRQIDPNGDNKALGRDNSGREVVFTDSGTIVIEDQIGVITQVDEYDFGIPGSGILIWHIDESILREKIADDLVNADKSHRAVDLEEADGAQDIGEPYGMLDAGWGSESGYWTDPFWASNEINMLVNDSETVEFTPDTHPNSRSYSGANTHIVISGFSESDTVMSFSVSNDLNQVGFPMFFDKDLTPYPPITGDINGDGSPEIVVATREGKVFAWQADASPLIDHPNTEYRVSFTGDTTFYLSALFIDAAESLVVPPIIFDVNRDGLDDELVFATRDCVHAYHTRNAVCEMIIDNPIPSGQITALAAWENGIFLGTNEGVIRVIDQHNQVAWESDAGNGSAVIGLCKVEESSVLATFQDGDVFIYAMTGQAYSNVVDQMDETGIPIGFPSCTDENVFSVYPRTSSSGMILTIGVESIEANLFEYPNIDMPFSHFAAGQIDYDWHPEMICTGQGQVWAFNHNGTLSNGFPVPTLERKMELSSPIVADTDGDEIPEILITTSEGNLEIVSTEGSMELTSLPLGGPSTITPRVVDLDGDGDIEVIAVSEEGTLSVFDLAGSPDDIQWAGYQNDSGHSGWSQVDMVSSHITVPATSIWAYNYPNPNIENYTIIRYNIEYSANVQIKIYDLSGDRVASFKGPGEPMTDNEVIWDLSDVDSGVYFCQVTATSGPREKIATFKIAVVK